MPYSKPVVPAVLVLLETVLPVIATDAGAELLNMPRSVPVDAFVVLPVMVLFDNVTDAVVIAVFETPVILPDAVVFW